MGTGIAVSVWGLIIAGILVLGLFIGWQAINPREPLVPLSLFSDRNFSVSNVAISAMGVVAISMAFPLTLYLQQVEGLDPTQAALMTAPMALFSGALAPVVGARLNRNDPKWIAVIGFTLMVVGFALLRPTMVAEGNLCLRPVTCRRSVPVPVRACTTRPARWRRCWVRLRLRRLWLLRLPRTCPRWVRLPQRAVALTAALLEACFRRSCVNPTRRQWLIP